MTKDKKLYILIYTELEDDIQTILGKYTKIENARKKMKKDSDEWLQHMQDIEIVERDENHIVVEDDIGLGCRWDILEK